MFDFIMDYFSKKDEETEIKPEEEIPIKKNYRKTERRRFTSSSKKQRVKTKRFRSKQPESQFLE